MLYRFFHKFHSNRYFEIHLQFCFSYSFHKYINTLELSKLSQSQHLSNTLWDVLSCSTFIQHSFECSLMLSIYPTLFRMFSHVQHLSNTLSDVPLCSIFIQYSLECSLMFNIYPTLFRMFSYVQHLANTLSNVLLCSTSIQHYFGCSLMFKETADLVTFTKEILNGKLHFLCSGKQAELNW